VYEFRWRLAFGPQQQTCVEFRFRSYPETLSENGAMSIRRLAILTIALLLLTSVTSSVFAQPGRFNNQPPPRDPAFDRGNPVGGLCCGGLVMLIPLLMALWVFNDAGNYGMNQVGWAALTFFFGLLGLVIYFVVRSSANSPSSRPRPRRRERRYDEDYDEDEDRPRRRRRRQRDDDDDERPRNRRDRDDDDIRRRDRWERDADY
jgi:hypothetical protein